MIEELAKPHVVIAGGRFGEELATQNKRMSSAPWVARHEEERALPVEDLAKAPDRLGRDEGVIARLDRDGVNVGGQGGEAGTDGREHPALGMGVFSEEELAEFLGGAEALS